MTIIVMGHISTEAGEVERLRPALVRMALLTREEEGCELYSFAVAVDDADTVIISERWASAEALAAHGASAHMAEFNKAVGGAKLKDISVKAWNGEFWRNLIGG